LPTFGGFRENNILPFASIAGLTPNQIGNLTNPLRIRFSILIRGLSILLTTFATQTARFPSQPCLAFNCCCLFPNTPASRPTRHQSANSIYQALQIRAEREFSNGLQFLVTFTWSKSIDDAS
jgi:hypothetical protein